MIYLELLNESDFPQIVDWVNQEPEDFIIQWAGLTYTCPLTTEQMKLHYSNGINTPESEVYIYRIMDENRFIGTIQLRFGETREATIGRFLIGNAIDSGKGIGQTVLRQLVRLGFTEFKLDRLKLNVFEFNQQAIKCYENIGFQKTLFREKLYKDSQGVWWNNYEMTLEKAEYS